MEEQQITQLAGMLQEALNSGNLESAIQTMTLMDQYDVEIKLTLTAPQAADQSYYQQSYYSQAQSYNAPVQGGYQQAQGSSQWNDSQQRTDGWVYDYTYKQYYNTFTGQWANS